MSDYDKGGPFGSWAGGEPPNTPPPPPSAGGNDFFASSPTTPPPSGPSFGQTPTPPYGQQPDAPYGEPVPPYAQPAPAGPVFDITPGAPVGRPGRQFSRSAVLATVAVLIVALVGTGVGARQLLHTGSGGAGPEKLVPSTAFMFADMRLAPSAEQRVAVFNFTRKFAGSPTTKAGATASSVRDTLLSSLFKSTLVDYDADIKPWLGDHLAVAGYTDTAGKAQGLALISVKDKGAAETTFNRLTKLSSSIAYKFNEDYAYIGTSAAVIDSAISQANTRSLADNETFSGDMATLDGDPLMVSWMDEQKLMAQVGGLLRTYGAAQMGAMCSATGSAGSSAGDGVDGSVTQDLQLGLQGLDSDLGGASSAFCAELNQFDALSKMATDGRFSRSFEGRALIAGWVHDDYLDFQVRSRGAATTVQLTTPVGDSLAALPDDTNIAVGLSSTKSLLSSYEDNLSLLGGLGLPGSSTSDPRALIKQALAGVGISYPDDITAFLGDNAALAMHEDPASDGDADVAVVTHPESVDKAKSIATKVSKASGEKLAFAVQGDALVSSTSQAYADKVAAGGKLGDQPNFRKAVGDTSHALMAAYVDVKAMNAANEDDVPLSALGMVVSRDGSDSVVQIRVVAG